VTYPNDLFVNIPIVITAQFLCVANGINKLSPSNPGVWKGP
jgi:hypothetical protein